MKFYRRTSFWLLVALFSFVAFFIYKKSTVTVQVKTVPAVIQDLDLTVTATSTGTIRSDMEIKITAQRAGKLTGLFVEEGDMVEAEQKVAEIDPVEAEINLKLSRAALEKASAVLSQMKSALNALLVEVETGIQSARARLREVEERYERYGKLHEEGHISRLKFIAIESEYHVAKADYEAALSRMDAFKAKKDEIKAQEAAVREAQNMLELAKLNYAYSFIKAPARGIISSRPVSFGETVANGTLIAVLITTDSLYIEAFIDEADVGRVRVGQEIRITMDAYPGEIFRSEVYKISPVVLGGRLETRTFEVRMRPPERGILVKPGMSADIEIVVESVRDCLVIQSQAVMDRDGKKYVYVSNGTRASLREIEVGLSDWTYTQVISGIEEGENVIITPDVPGLEDGARIDIEGQ